MSGINTEIAEIIERRKDAVAEAAVRCWQIDELLTATSAEAGSRFRRRPCRMRIRMARKQNLTDNDDYRGLALATAIRQAKLLIVDDEAINVLLLEDMLQQAGYSHIHSTKDPHQVVSLCRSVCPDLILLDLMMPGMDGIAVMQQLKAEWPDAADVPVLMLTADISTQSKQRALVNGAKDFLTKPFDAVELFLRIENLLETRFLYLNLQRQNQSLEERVQARTVELQARTVELEASEHQVTEYARQLEVAQVETLERLVHAGEFRDDETGQHTYRVSETTARLAQLFGYPPEHLHWLRQAARLHDVGKIGISDLILLKPGKLTEEEFVTMRTHTTIGAALLTGGKTELFQIAHRIAAGHHERWDGTGYPQGLHGEAIPLEARLVAVADVFDALTHERPYKRAWDIADAVAEIRRQSGHQFDPRVVEEFLRLPHEDLL